MADRPHKPERLPPADPELEERMIRRNREMQREPYGGALFLKNEKTGRYESYLLRVKDVEAFGRIPEAD